MQLCSCPALAASTSTLESLLCLEHNLLQTLLCKLSLTLFAKDEKIKSRILPDELISPSPPQRGNNSGSRNSGGPHRRSWADGKTLKANELLQTRLLSAPGGSDCLGFLSLCGIWSLHLSIGILGRDFDVFEAREQPLPSCSRRSRKKCLCPFRSLQRVLEAELRGED